MTVITFDFEQFGFDKSYYLELEKSQKHRKIVLGIFCFLFVLLSLLAVYLTVNYQGEDLELGPFFLHGKSHGIRIAQALGGVALVFVPLILELIFKFRSSVLNIFVYEIYLFMALGIGSILEGFSSIDHYDDLAHFVAGGLGAILGISIWLNLLAKPRRRKNGEPFLGPGYAFGLFMTGFFGVIWEIFEFTADGIIPYRNTQRTYFPDGMPRLGRDAIWDTMKDLTVNILGALFGLILAWRIYLKCQGNYDRQFLFLKAKTKRDGTKPNQCFP